VLLVQKPEPGITPYCKSVMRENCLTQGRGKSAAG